MQALILVGGLGTRLKELVSDRPKPMADVNNKPFLDYILKELFKFNIRNIIFAVGYKGEMVEDYFGDGSANNCKYKYSYEKELLGTGGAIKNAYSYITEDQILVLNGDTFFKTDYNLLTNFKENEKAEMTIVLRKVNDISRYGEVKLEDNNIIGFNEKSKNKTNGIINGGIYLINKELIETIPSEKCSLENDLIPQWLNESKKITGFINSSYFIDIGIPEDYLKFINDVKNGSVK